MTIHPLPLLGHALKIAGEPPVTEMLDYLLRRHLDWQHRELRELVTGAQGWALKAACKPSPWVEIEFVLPREAPGGLVSACFTVPFAEMKAGEMLPFVPHEYRCGPTTSLSFAAPNGALAGTFCPLDLDDPRTDILVSWCRAAANECDYAARVDGLLRGTAAKLRTLHGDYAKGPLKNQPKGHATPLGVLARLHPEWRRATGTPPCEFPVVPKHLTETTAERIRAFVDRCAVVAPIEAPYRPRFSYS